MSDERPLRVLVAEALGWTEIGYGRGYEPLDGLMGDAPDGRYAVDLPPYGEDSEAGWAATGPLLGRFWIMAWPLPTHGTPESWAAMRRFPPDEPDFLGFGPSACEAIARAVVALAAAGKLTPQPSA